MELFEELFVAAILEFPEANAYVFLNKLERQIRAGLWTRKELLEHLIKKGVNRKTAVTQITIWANDHNIKYADPLKAAEMKKNRAHVIQAIRFLMLQAGIDREELG